MTGLDDLPDELVRWALGFLAHGGGKAAVARTGRRARDLHALLVSPGFAAWARLLSRKHRRWVSGLAIAPPIRAGFEPGAAVSLRTVGQTNDVIKRLVASSDIRHYGHRMTRDAVLFIALGLLTDSRIEEFLEAELTLPRWRAVFVRVNEYRADEHLNTMLIDPLFSFAEWKKAIITCRYTMMVAVKQDGMRLQEASAEVRADHGVVTEAVKQNGQALKWASIEVKNDRGVAVEAIRQDYRALQFVSDELKADRGVAEQAMETWVFALQWASDELKGDKSLVEGAIKRDGRVLQHASAEMKSDRSLVQEAMNTHETALQYASAGLKADRSFILEAVEKYGGALEFASAELKADHWVVLQAVKKDGNALKFASVELKADRGVVTVAVEQTGQALQYAPTALKADRGVVLEAVKTDGKALRWASGALRADYGVVATAMKTHVSAIIYASASVHAAFDFCGQCFEFNEDCRRLSQAGTGGCCGQCGLLERFYEISPQRGVHCFCN